MVYMTFPSNLTEEELMLQAKYNKLKRKKKALQDLKAPKPEPERTPQTPKRPTEARDAREVAKKLIKSGVITAPKTPKRGEQAFKRPRGLERKLNSIEKAVPSYQPFSAIQQEDEPSEPPRQKVKGLYESFVSASDPGNKSPTDKATLSKPEPYKIRGNTIFVSGYKISDEFLKKHFSRFGVIVKITIEAEKKAFITFEKIESAELAINEMDGIMASSIQLKVSMARRQPVIEAIGDSGTSSLWAPLAASYTAKTKTTDKEKRELKVYEDDLFS
ncbi:negative elongation factor E [Copidosoma floridanum]|uniref:negative elongation factor E n=1 Tax=Copidosoma floridanum TaxID=29053 RepID=UPI0006C9A30E|nr:negative elongation factor E [Copidosoma floridanum]